MLQRNARMLQRNANRMLKLEVATKLEQVRHADKIARTCPIWMFFTHFSYAYFFIRTSSPFTNSGL
jgi:hypothetical protein